MDVSIVEVGPRDGLQNEASFVPTDVKIAFINQLTASGLKHIEVTSFVSAKAIPQLADNEAVFKGIDKPVDGHYSALVPNEQGMLKAIAAGVTEIAIFTAASETFNQRNINCSIKDSIQRFEPVVALAKAHNISVRAYISCALGCPYEGEISASQVARVASLLLNLNVDEICLGDTIGVGTPRQTKEAIKSMQSLIPSTQLAMHFHNTWGQAIGNIVASIDCGIYRFDSSVAGLGGCPYARGASGNVATEDVLYLMHGLGLNTGIDIFKVVQAGDAICKALNRKNQSNVATALLGATEQSFPKS